MLCWVKISIYLLLYMSKCIQIYLSDLSNLYIFINLSSFNLSMFIYLSSYLSTYKSTYFSTKHPYISILQTSHQNSFVSSVLYAPFIFWEKMFQVDFTPCNNEKYIHRFTIFGNDIFLNVFWYEHFTPS